MINEINHSPWQRSHWVVCVLHTAYPMSGVLIDGPSNERSAGREIVGEIHRLFLLAIHRRAYDTFLGDSRCIWSMLSTLPSNTLPPIFCHQHSSDANRFISMNDNICRSAIFVSEQRTGNEPFFLSSSSCVSRSLNDARRLYSNT